MTTTPRKYTRLAKQMAGTLCLLLASSVVLAHECECENDPQPVLLTDDSDTAVVETPAEDAQPELETASTDAETIDDAQATEATTADDTVSEQATAPAVEDVVEEKAPPVYTVQVLAYRSERTAKIRSRVVPKLYGKPEVVTEKSQRKNQPKVYTIIAGRFDGYTAAKEAAVRLCEPVYLSGCFVRQMDSVDANRYVEPEPTETAGTDK